MLRGMSSPAAGPINKNNIHGFLGIRLNSVNEKLTANPHVRDFTMTLPYQLDTPPTPQTPLFPHPLYPLEFWRTWATSKRQTYMLMNSKPDGSKAEDPRFSIKDANYWKCEAAFWSSKLSSRTRKRRRHDIPDAMYWRCEAKFWRDACASQHTDADRMDIEDSDYWKCESGFWRTINRKVSDNARFDINEPEYWKCENMHYNIVLGLDGGVSSPQTGAETSSCSHGKPVRRSARLRELQKKSTAKQPTQSCRIIDSSAEPPRKKRKMIMEHINNSAIPNTK